MRWFRNLKIARKLLAGCLLVMVVFLVGTLFTMRQQTGALRRLDADVRAATTQQADTAAVKYELMRIARSVRAALLAEDAVRRAKYLGELQESVKHIEERQGPIGKRATGTDEKAAFATLSSGWSAYRAHMDRLVELISSGRREEAETELLRGRVMREEAEGATVILEQSALKSTERELDEFGAEMRSIQLESLAVGGFATVVFLAVILLFSRAVTRPLAEMTRVVKRMADSDFTARVNYDSHDEIGDLAEVLNFSQLEVALAMDTLKGVARQVSDASSQLTSNASEISAGASEQASGFEETAASLEEITSTVKQTAQNSEEITRLANQSRDQAQRGQTIVDTAVVAMAELSESSRQIADIITTIDEIAFQTNLLALNAAVEAARAGEQGRGFAVVAHEVRNLAQRSATAAREIKVLINNSVGKIDTGVDLVNQSGQSLRDIVASVQKVTELMGEIAAASKEQSIGVEQVNKAVMTMDQITQRNATQTQGLNATAGHLSKVSQDMEALVTKFRFGLDQMETHDGGQFQPLPSSGAPPTAGPTAHVHHDAAPVAPAAAPTQASGFEPLPPSAAPARPEGFEEY